MSVPSKSKMAATPRPLGRGPDILQQLFCRRHGKLGLSRGITHIALTCGFQARKKPSPSNAVTAESIAFAVVLGVALPARYRVTSPGCKTSLTNVCRAPNWWQRRHLTGYPLCPAGHRHNLSIGVRRNLQNSCMIFSIIKITVRYILAVWALSGRLRLHCARQVVTTGRCDMDIRRRHLLGLAAAASAAPLLKAVTMNRYSSRTPVFPVGLRGRLHRRGGDRGPGPEAAGPRSSLAATPASAMKPCRCWRCAEPT